MRALLVLGFIGSWAVPQPQEVQVDRSERIVLAAESVGRSHYFISRTFNLLVDLELMHHADQMVDALLKLRDIEVELVKLSRGHALLPGQEHLFDDAGQRLPF